MSDIPQARIHGAGDLRLDQVAPPDCGPNDVVVRVRECGICGSDIGYLAMGGITASGEPMRLGHELWGEVFETGANVTHVGSGDRVVVQPMSDGLNIGNGGSEGGFTPLLLVRDAALRPDSTLKLPEDVLPTWGALVEPLAVAQHGLNRVEACANDRVVVFGAGPIGLCMVQALQYRGVTNIVVVDLSPARLAAAEALGATALRADDPALAAALVEAHGSSEFFGMALPGSSLWIEATGVGAVFEQIIGLAGPGSRVCLTGLHKEPVSLDLMMLLAKEVSIVPAMGYENEFDEVVTMLRSGQLQPDVIVTHRYPLSQLQTAFDMAHDTSRAIKVMVDCQA